MRLFPVVLFLAAASVACTMFDAEDSGDTAAPADTGTAGNSGHQTQSCRDYLSCLEAVDSDQYDKVKAKYGSDGSCWDTENDMHDCDDECEAELATLQEDHPNEPDCADGAGDADTDIDADSDADADSDTDTDTDADNCALRAGDWIFPMELTENTCDESTSLDFNAGITCTDASAGDFEISLEELGSYPLPCASDGADFYCVTESPFYVELYGTALGSGSSAYAYLTFEADCMVSGEGEGSLR